MDHMENIFDFDETLIEKMAHECRLASYIEPELYEKYNVKRGLRNADGTGVLVGLTNVGDVRGYYIEENEKIPMEGKLLYRGIRLTDLVKGFQAQHRYGFEEITFLLLTGRLPTAEELKEFIKELGEMRRLPEGFAEDMIMKAPSPNLMNKLQRSVLATYSYDDNAEDMSIENQMRQAVKLIASLPTMAAYAYQAKAHYCDGRSLYIHNPDPDLSTSEVILQMIRHDSKYTPLEAEILDLCLVVHAEHGGGNNSSFTINVVSSTGTDTYSAVSAAIGSLKGPRHGGANLKVMEMMNNIKANIDDWDDEQKILDYLVKIIRREAFDRTGLIYGMGHAIYTLSDPRAVLLKAKAEELSVEKGREKEFRLYSNIEKLTTKAFEIAKGQSRTICANVDLYSGFVYSMLNIPIELYTPLFAIGRISGWCAHRLEEVAYNGKLIRPAFKNTGAKQQYIPLDERVQ